MPLATVHSIPCTSAAFAQLSAEILRAGKALRFRARGASMQPLLRDGDVLLVQPMGSRPVQLGDVVLCSGEAGHVVVHRVVRRLAGPDSPLFTVQGDQLPRPDGALRGVQVYGRVVAIERSGAHIALDWPLMRMLSVLAVLRSRWNLGRLIWPPLVSRLVKRLPVLSRYLA
jgi:hypothetical protein